MLESLNLNEEQMAAIEKIIQSETDKVRTKYSTELRTVQEELNKFKPKEKSEDEKALEERIKALEDREKAITAKEKAQALSAQLKEKGLPDISQYLSADVDVESLSQVVNSFMVNNSFKPDGHGANEGISKNDFAGMNYMERMKLYNESPDLYKSLSQ
ncbi:MAG: hypothetical protein K5675_08615 [Lachnospiraceae bacterium]|nr:hypothetical protein [Lachnospiraceae bacterium]